MNILASTPTPAPAPATSFPSKNWSSWNGHTSYMYGPAAPHTPNPTAVAQADFIPVGPGWYANFNLDVFSGATVGRFHDVDAAFGAAQALEGARGVVGVFASGADFAVRELRVAPGITNDDIRLPNFVDQRPVPRILTPLQNTSGDPKNWSRELAAVRFIAPGLLGFVSGDLRVVRPNG